MPPLAFNNDLATAQNTEIESVSNVMRGNESGTITFTYHHHSLASPTVIQMMSYDCMSYPDNIGFIFYENDSTDCRFTHCFDTVSEQREWKGRQWENITEVIQAISTAITDTIENGQSPSSDSPLQSNEEDEDEKIQLDEEDEDEELYLMELDSNNGDRLGSQQKDAIPGPAHPQMLASLTSSLRKAQRSGIIVGIYPVYGTTIPQVISLSIGVACLGVSAGALEVWGLRDTDSLVLLLHIESMYPSLEDFLTKQQKALRFRFGRCRGEKPSLDSVQSAFPDANWFPKVDCQTTQQIAQQPFELIKMSNTIDKLLNCDFSSLLGLRRDHQLSWDRAQARRSQKESRGACSADKDQRPLRNLIGAISQDNALDDGESFSLPLVAMQLALHRLANCTRYCMACNALVPQTLQTVKPYVCDNHLCLFQYLELGLGSSIEHEIINAPYVVDMLVSFLYSALENSPARELPHSLYIKAAYVDEKWAEKAYYMTASANMGASKMRNVDSWARREAQKGMAVPLSKGDCIILVHHEPDPRDGSDAYIFVKSWCRLISRIDGEWTFERLQTADSPLNRQSNKLRVTDNDGWCEAQIFGYWHDIDELDIDQKRCALLTILDGLPSVLDMWQYLNDKPGQFLKDWSRMNASELSVLNWTVASNRSLIVQDDTLVKPENPLWRKLSISTEDSEYWMQFRFLQGSPDREHAFEDKVKQLTQTTSTPTIFAWHGSNLKNWHSIIRAGLDFTSVENSRSYGNGVYFSRNFAFSRGYCLRGSILQSNQKDPATPWDKSQLRIGYAIAVCELINQPSEFVSQNPHYVVDKLDWIQCRYLFVKIKPTREAIELPFFNPDDQESPNYVPQDPTHQLLGAKNQPVEVPITAIPYARQEQGIQHCTDISMEDCRLSVSRRRFIYDADDVALYLGAGDAETGAIRTGTKRSSSPVPESPMSQSRSKRNRTESDTSLHMSIDTAGFNPKDTNIDSLCMLQPPAWASTSREAVRRLQLDMKDLHERQTTQGELSCGYYVHTNSSDNMFQWIVELFDFDAELPLARDMAELSCRSIVLELRFGPNYPMSPPFARVIRPRFVPFAQGGGGHVTSGGAVCLEMLTMSGWNPAIHIDNVIMQIRAAIGETERPARIDRAATGDYGVGEAVAAFRRLAREHQWEVPQDVAAIAE